MKKAKTTRQLRQLERELKDSLEFEQQIKISARKRANHRVTLRKQIAKLKAEILSQDLAQNHQRLRELTARKLANG